MRTRAKPAGARPFPRVLTHAPLDKVREVFGQIYIRRNWNVVFGYLHHQTQRASVGVVVRVFTQRALQHHHPKGPHVSREVVILVLHAFRGHVKHGTFERVEERSGVSEFGADAEIGDFWRPWKQNTTSF